MYFDAYRLRTESGRCAYKPQKSAYSFYGHETHKKRGHGIIRNPLILWWRRRDLNPRPPPCEGDAQHYLGLLSTTIFVEIIG